MKQVLLALLIAFPAWQGVSAAVPDTFEQERSAFTEEVIRRHNLDPEFVRQTVGAAKYQQSIIDAMNRPTEAKPWHEYREIFLTSKRIQGGVKFWSEHAETLARAERTYGVPAQIIVAIVGVETHYGGYMGSFRVVDALSTLGFAYPARAEFFRGQLEEFLLLVNEEPVEPLGVKGSYAGAMGLPQFIPSSYRDFAVDFDGDGQRDLLGSVVDVIGSVANYLHRHAWQRGGSITSPVRGSGKVPASYIEAGMKPSFTLAELAAAGIEPVDSGVTTSLASVIELEGKDGPEYWLGFDNFYAITRYNHSNLYAMAVFQLSEAIREGYAPQPAFDLTRARP